MQVKLAGQEGEMQMLINCEKEYKKAL